MTIGSSSRCYFRCRSIALLLWAARRRRQHEKSGWAPDRVWPLAAAEMEHRPVFCLSLFFYILKHTTKSRANSSRPALSSWVNSSCSNLALIKSLKLSDELVPAVPPKTWKWVNASNSKSCSYSGQSGQRTRNPSYVPEISPHGKNTGLPSCSAVSNTRKAPKPGEYVRNHSENPLSHTACDSRPPDSVMAPISDSKCIANG